MQDMQEGAYPKKRNVLLDSKIKRGRLRGGQVLGHPFFLSQLRFEIIRG